MPAKSEQPIVCVIGLGYVGLPLAMEFSRHFKVIGFDTNIKLVKELNIGNNNQNLTIINNPQQIKQADFIIITVPTPVTKSKEPDLSHIESASRIISQNMKAGCTIILESTVYPGVTEEVVKPILEESGLQCGNDFKIAYSPERINPGDDEHTIDRVTKVVSGMDEGTTELVAELYSKINYDDLVNIFLGFECYPSDEELGIEAGDSSDNFRLSRFRHIFPLEFKVVKALFFQVPPF